MAYYDDYDYTTFWQERDYEHRSEVLALESLRRSVPQLGRCLDIGGGFGRLIPNYRSYCTKITLLDPSQKNLDQARRFLGLLDNIQLLQGQGEKLPFRKSSFDTAILVRVLHHLPDPSQVISQAARVIKPGGHLILEHANKSHLKNAITLLAKADMHKLTSSTPIDRRSKLNRLRGSIPFVNHDPNSVLEILGKHHFDVLTRFSVSHLRIPLLKKYLPIDLLLGLESKLQQLSMRYHIYPGPSIFILARRSE